MNNTTTNHGTSIRQVLDHHMKAFELGDVEEVLKDYTEDSILIEPNATHKGIDALRKFFAGLFSGIFEPGSYDFVMDRSSVEGDVIYIVWRTNGRAVDITLGTDTFLVRDGKFAVQTFAGKIEET
jgi:ketosteroid isomerase-like protein